MLPGAPAVVELVAFVALATAAAPPALVPAATAGLCVGVLARLGVGAGAPLVVPAVPPIALLALLSPAADGGSMFCAGSLV
jgi:hypothetical protein